jgi:hypothetical protein
LFGSRRFRFQFSPLSKKPVAAVASAKEEEQEEEEEEVE